MVIRKNKFTTQFFQNMIDIINDDNKLFNNTYGYPHRHDQSIMSMLYKCMNGNLLLEDETWFGNKGGFNTHFSNQFPFWATRSIT